jgi:hypothetical protein
MLPATEFSNLRRFTRIAECVMAVARPCKSITLNSDCYLLSLKCCKSEKRKMDSIAAVRKLLGALAKSSLYLAGQSFCCLHRPIYRVLCEPSKEGVANFPRKRFPLLEPESSSLLGGAVAANCLVIGGGADSCLKRHWPKTWRGNAAHSQKGYQWIRADRKIKSV